MFKESCHLLTQFIHMAVELVQSMHGKEFIVFEMLLVTTMPFCYVHKGSSKQLSQETDRKDSFLQVNNYSSRLSLPIRSFILVAPCDLVPLQGLIVALLSFRPWISPIHLAVPVAAKNLVEAEYAALDLVQKETSLRYPSVDLDFGPLPARHSKDLSLPHQV